jgi:23S rRNA (cytidine1920-2'-O)/16S rRNA (cytidine1409-2'-O)-methyltransferase
VSSATTRHPRQRLDQLVVDRGLVDSRARAQALILAGKVRTGTGDSVRLDRKAGDLVDVDLPIAIAEPDPYVSRGGHKLAAALDAFGIDPAGLVCLDAGASTGGFSDVLLQRGALRVHAVDVGRGQLAERVARDRRVVVHDRTNARMLTPGSFGEPIELAVVDVSFISLALVLGPIASTLRDLPTASIVALVKPQFEVGKGGTDRGVVRDPGAHRAVLVAVRAAASALGLGMRAVIASPILGPEGNREFLVHLAAGPARAAIDDMIATLTGTRDDDSPSPSPVAGTAPSEAGS